MLHKSIFLLCCYYGCVEASLNPGCVYVNIPAQFNQYKIDAASLMG